MLDVKMLARGTIYRCNLRCGPAPSRHRHGKAGRKAVVLGARTYVCGGGLQGILPGVGDIGYVVYVGWPGKGNANGM